MTRTYVIPLIMNQIKCDGESKCSRTYRDQDKNLQACQEIVINASEQRERESIKVLELTSSRSGPTRVR